MLFGVGFSANPLRIKVLLVAACLLVAVVTSGAVLADGPGIGGGHCGGGC
jgi:hypothetical protein